MTDAASSLVPLTFRPYSPHEQMMNGINIFYYTWIVFTTALIFITLGEVTFFGFALRELAEKIVGK